MSTLELVRRFALLDLLVTGLLAVPWVSDRAVALLLTWFGLDGSPADCLPGPTMMVFVNLAGVLGVLWNGRRWLDPTDDLVRWDLWGRLAVAGLILYYVLVHDVPSMLLLFVVTELGGAWAARRHLAGVASS